MMVCESGEFSIIYQGRSSNFREANNLVYGVINGVYKGELKDTELFLFSKNWVFESVFYMGNSKITLLFEKVLYLHRIQMEGGLIIYVVHV